MELMTVQEASAALGIPQLSLREMMKQGEIDIGYAHKAAKRWTFYISRKLVEQEAKRLGGNE